MINMVKVIKAYDSIVDSFLYAHRYAREQNYDEAMKNVVYVLTAVRDFDGAFDTDQLSALAQQFYETLTPYVDFDKLSQDFDRDECLICQEDLGYKTRFNQAQLRCKHKFHQVCINAWFGQVSFGSTLQISMT